MKAKIFLPILFMSAVLVGCGQADSNNEATSKETEVVNIKEVVSDYSSNKTTNDTASITSQELIIEKSDGNELAYDLSEEDFFVSIAPYVNETHPWTNHSLTGCQGELVEEEFDVFIEDMEGNVIIDEKVKSQTNGFIDLWIPRDKTYRIKIKHDGKVSESEISTFENDGTCITNMQLT